VHHTTVITRFRIPSGILKVGSKVQMPLSLFCHWEGAISPPLPSAPVGLAPLYLEPYKGGAGRCSFVPTAATRSCYRRTEFLSVAAVTSRIGSVAPCCLSSDDTWWYMPASTVSNPPLPPEVVTGGPSFSQWRL
jgi:hypothetical protein